MPLPSRPDDEFHVEQRGSAPSGRVVISCHIECIWLLAVVTRREEGDFLGKVHDTLLLLPCLSKHKAKACDPFATGTKLSKLVVYHLFTIFVGVLPTLFFPCWIIHGDFFPSQAKLAFGKFFTHITRRNVQQTTSFVDAIAIIYRANRSFSYLLHKKERWSVSPRLLFQIQRISFKSSELEVAV